jgi:hypothetical protein
MLLGIRVEMWSGECEGRPFTLGHLVNMNRVLTLAHGIAYSSRDRLSVRKHTKPSVVEKGTC